MLSSILMLAAASAGWVYDKSVDQFTDAVSHSARAVSKSGKMSVEFSCGGKGKAAYSFVIDGGFGGEYIGGEGIKRIPINIRVGKRAAVSIEVLGMRAIAPSYQGQGRDFDRIDAEVVSGEPSMIVRAQTMTGGFATESFDMKGAQQAIAKAKAACGLS